MKLVGITGSIGCGKTTLAKIVKELGYVVFDIDAWVRRIYFNKAFLQVLEQYFSGVVENGVANKRKLRNIVFADKQKLKLLEGLIHPFLVQNIKSVIRKNACKDDLFFVDAALLFEQNWDRFCDFVIVADVAYEIQKQRVMKRDNISAEEFDKINNIQMKNSDKIKNADIVVNTDNRLNLLKNEMIYIINGLEACND